MGTKIAVQGMTVETNPSTILATIVVAPPTGSKLKASGKQAHLDGDKVTVTNITTATATTPDPGPYTVPFNATVSKVLSEGKLVLVEGDESDTINATPQTPAPAPEPVSFTIKISVAGQDKAFAK